MEDVKKKFADLQNRFIDEIKALNNESAKVKEESQKYADAMWKEKQELCCKIDILEASLQEENRISVNKISSLKIKQLLLTKQVDEKDKEIESMKKEKKDLWLKNNSQRRITKTLQDKIEKLNKIIVEMQSENDKLKKS